MNLSAKAEAVYAQLDEKTTKMGDIRKIAKGIKRDHELAQELWAIGEMLPRRVAILIMDKNQLSQEVIDQLDADLQQHTVKEQNYLMEWLMANQLSKSKKTIALMESWEHSSSVLQRRTFWYYQTRLRWTGQAPPSNSEYLLAAIEERMEHEEPQVQWAMNFTAGQIGIHQPEFRARCIALGERLGLYKDEVVPRGCVPSYLPEFIAVEAAKWKK